MLPVRALGLEGVRQAGEDHGDLRRPGCFRRFRHQGRVRLRRMGVEAPGKDDVLPGRRLQGADRMGHVDVAAAGALIAGPLRELPDEGRLLPFANRQDATLVLHQHGAFPGQLPGQLPAGVPVDDRRPVPALQAVPHEGQQPQHGFIQIRLRQPALPDRLQDFAAVGIGAAGHLQIQAGGHAPRPVLDRTPVRDHKAVKAPLVPQNIVQEGFILGAEGAVDGVIGAHEAAGLSLFDHLLEGREIDLPQGPLIQLGGAAHALRLLVVAGEMLCAGGDALALQGLHIGRGHLPRRVGILGEIFKVPAAQGAPLDVQPRSQQHGHVLRLAFLP